MSDKSELKKAFIEGGLDERRADETLKNNKLSKALLEILKEV